MKNAAKGAKRVWDLNELILALEACKDYRACDKFAREAGNFVGSGIHRNTFVVQTKKFPVVVKVARHSGAFGSNLSEVRVSHDYRKSPVIAKIYAHDKRGHWIVAEFVPEETKMGKIAEFFGVKLPLDRHDLKCADHRFSTDILSKDSTKEHPWIKDYNLLIRKENVHDLHGGNWRMRPSGEPVIVDYGFSRHH